MCQTALVWIFRHICAAKILAFLGRVWLTLPFPAGLRHWSGYTLGFWPVQEPRCPKGFGAEGLIVSEGSKHATL